jgi:prevent-host-death family protein
MKSVTVTELKAHLSAYLRKASRGARIVVMDRTEPVAQLGPLEPSDQTWRERLTRQGRLKRGSQDWGSLQLSRLGRAVDIQRALDDVRGDASDLRRR